MTRRSMNFQEANGERFRRWLLDRWIVHIAILLWSAPAMYRALLECQTYLGRTLPEDTSCRQWRNEIVDLIAKTIWFMRKKWGNR